MENNSVEYVKLQLHIESDETMSLESLADSLAELDGCFKRFYSEHPECNAEDYVGSPQITGVSNGSIIIDILVPLLAAALPELIKMVRESIKRKRKNIRVKISKTSREKKWSYRDNVRACTVVLEECVKGRKKAKIDVLIDKTNLSTKYSEGSVRMKIQNIKHLINENELKNTLQVSPLSGCSKDLRKAFEEVCGKLGIKL